VTHGPRDPRRETPARPPGSARRTSSISILRSHGSGQDLVLAGRARDVVTGRDGTGSVVGAAEVTATLDRARKLQYFRPDMVGDRPAGHPRSDVCSGWRADGTMMTAIRDEGRIPVPIGPPAPPLERQGDELSWHRLEPLPPGGMRRHRRLDVYRDLASETPLRVDAMFRDTHVDPDGVETVLHEYSIEATVDEELRFTSIEAAPRVLPWIECPWAAPSATRLCGQPVHGLRRLVRDNFHGVETCTHLNDMLRSLADIAPLAARLTAV